MNKEVLDELERKREAAEESVGPVPRCTKCNLHLAKSVAEREYSEVLHRAAPELIRAARENAEMAGVLGSVCLVPHIDSDEQSEKLENHPHAAVQAAMGLRSKAAIAMMDRDGWAHRYATLKKWWIDAVNASARGGIRAALAIAERMPTASVVDVISAIRTELLGEKRPL